MTYIKLTTQQITSIKDQEEKKKDPLNKDYYTLKEVSSITSMHYMTVRNHAISGELKTTEIGKSKRVSKEQLQNYLKKS